MIAEMPDGWRYNKLRKEIICPHGVGHPVPWAEKSVHGCDGCCTRSPTEENSEWSNAVAAAKSMESEAVQIE